MSTVGGVKTLTEMKKRNEALEKQRKRVSSSRSADPQMDDLIAGLEEIRFDRHPAAPLAREITVNGPKLPIGKSLRNMKKSALFDALDDIVPAAPSMAHKRASERIRGQTARKAYNTEMMPMTPPALAQKSKASVARPSKRPSASSPMPPKVDIKAALIGAFSNEMNARLAANQTFPARAYADGISKVMAVAHIRTKEELKAAKLGEGKLYQMGKDMLKAAPVADAMMAGGRM
jgi:hypothetical protein